MHRYTTFPSLRGCTLRRSLERLVAECRGRHGPHRPVVGPLKIMVVDGTALPAWLDLSSFSPADLAACQIFQVVEHEPSLTLRTPEPLLWLAARPYVGPLAGAAPQPSAPNLSGTGPSVTTPAGSVPPATVQACARRSQGRCCGRCRGDMQLHVYQSPLFPLDEDEVNYLLAAGCGLKDHPWCRVPRWGQKLRTALQELLCSQPPPALSAPTTLSAPTASSASTAPGAGAAPAAGATPTPPHTLVHGRPPRKQAGAPCQPYNLRLERTIEKLPDIHAYHHLEGPWLKWHKAATGEDLADPKRSFATTAQRCVARIERRRAHA